MCGVTYCKPTIIRNIFASGFVTNIYLALM